MWKLHEMIFTLAFLNQNTSKIEKLQEQASSIQLLQ